MKLSIFFVFILTFHSFANETIFVVEKALKPELIQSKSLKSNFDIEKDLELLPNISTSKGSNKTKFLQVRGVGLRENFSPLVRRYNQFFIDEIDYSEFPQAFEQFGFHQNIIQYGPSLRGAAGATFISESKELDYQSKLKAFAETGSFGYQSQKIAFSPSAKTILKPEISLIRIKENGFYNNSFLNRNDTNNRDEFFIRTVISSPEFMKQQFKYRFHYNRLDNGYDAFVQDNSTKMNSDRPGQDDLNMQVHQLSLHSAKKNKLFVEYMKSHSLYSYDEDWGNNNLWLNFSGFNSTYDYFIEFISNKERYSIYDIYKINNGEIELRANQSKENHLERGFNEGNPRSKINTILREQNILLNAKKVFYFGNNISISSGLGLQSHSLRISNQDLNRELNERLLSAHFSFNYKNLFSSIKTAEIPGGANMQSEVPDDRSLYKKVRINTFEVGLNFENKYGKNKITSFYTIRNNPQIKTSFQRDINDPSTFTFYNDNTSNAIHYGLEITNSLKLTKWFDWQSSISFLKTSFGNYPFGERNLKDRELPQSPEYQFKLVPKFKFNRKLSTSITYYQQDNFYFSNSHDQKGFGYSLVNLNLSYALKRMNITGFVDNLFNESYQTRGFFFGNNPPNFENQLFTQLGRPRSFGLSLELFL